MTETESWVSNVVTVGVTEAENYYDKNTVSEGVLESENNCDSNVFALDAKIEFLLMINDSSLIPCGNWNWGVKPKKCNRNEFKWIICEAKPT